MKRDFSALADKDFDLLIIGGGIIGAGIAWDASQRGLSCALVEKGDFASGTSSKTTKLIHGGIRYLENLDFKLVREAIQERETLLKLAPRLVKPLPFLIPVKGKSPRPWPWVKLGIFLYGRMARNSSLERHRFLNGQEVAQREPILASADPENGTIYQDAQMDDARLVIETLQAADKSGAKMANHCSVVRLILDKKRVVGAELEDRLSGKRYTLRSRVAVNAAGPWVDQIRRMADPSARLMIRPSKGIHLVYPDLGIKHAILLSSARDQRIFFLIPWKGLTLIGTTDTDYSGDPGESLAERSDVEYLLGETNRLLPGLRLEKSKILSTFSGVRPLVRYQGPFLKRYLVPFKDDPWALSRGHRIHQDKNSLVSVLGGKFTTFRKIAQDLVDWVAPRFPEKKLSPCRTHQSPLGLDQSHWRGEEIQRLLKGLLQQGGIYPTLVPHLVQRYDSRAEQILRWIKEDARMAEPLCPHHPFVKAEVRYAVEEEMALSLSDLFWRRFSIGHSSCQGLDAIDSAAVVMGQALNWDGAELRRQIDRYQEEVALTHRFQ